MTEKNNSQFSILNSPLTRVALVEDHKVVASGLEQLINSSKIAQVVGIAHSIAECKQLLERDKIDLLLLDVNLPDGSGIDLCRPLKVKYPDLKILMLTSHSEISIIMRVLEEGADGYILKNAATEEIVEGIRIVASGEQFLCNEVKKMLKNRDEQLVRLSRREQELLQLIAAGLSNNEIADKMFLGYETVKSYRKNLCLKLNAHNTAQLIKIAVEEMLI